MDAAINVFSAASASDCLLASAVAQLASTSPENALYQRGWRLAYLIASNIGDHLAAIGDVAGAREARPFAHMTLARAALEGAARLWFLMYPPGSVGDRIHRAAALLLGSSDEEARPLTRSAAGTHNCTTRRPRALGAAIGNSSTCSNAQG